MQRSQCNNYFRRSGSDYPRGRSRQDDRTSREWNTRHILPIHPIPCDSPRMRGCMLLRGSHKTRVWICPRFRMQSRLFRTRTSWRVLSAWADAFPLRLEPPRSGTAGGNEKASGPCRAIEIVAVMRLTTSSARLESNPRERNSVLVRPRDEDQKSVIVRNLNRGSFRARRT
jgi:hypothetical protein